MKGKKSKQATNFLLGFRKHAVLNSGDAQPAVPCHVCGRGGHTMQWQGPPEHIQKHNTSARSIKEESVA